MKTDKQLLGLTKTELLEEYRKLEDTKRNQDISLNEAIELLKSNGYVVKPKTSYDF